MPLAALAAGVGGGWTSFGQYLDLLDGHLGVNAAFLVGHCALRRYVMGPDGTGNGATPAQVDQMRAVLHEAIEAEVRAAIAAEESVAPPPLATLVEDVFAKVPPALREQLAELAALPARPPGHGS